MSKLQPNMERGFEHGQLVQPGVIPAKSTSRKALISASASVDTSVLRQALVERGITPFELDEVGIEGHSIPELLEDCLKRADLVVAFVSGGNAKDKVLFELGYAMALKKRILTLVPPEEDPPFSEIPYLRTRPDNREAIEFGLDQILKAPEPRKHTRRDEIRQTKPLGPFADELLDRIRGSKEELGGEDLEQILREVIQRSGIDSTYYASERVGTPRSGADMAIWSDDFEPWLGNPLLIELKRHLRNRSELRNAVSHFSKILDNTHTAWGLLIYGSADFEPGEDALRDPRVFVLTIERLLESLRDTSLGDFLRHSRNLRVHARG